MSKINGIEWNNRSRVLAFPDNCVGSRVTLAMFVPRTSPRERAKWRREGDFKDTQLTLSSGISPSLSMPRGRTPEPDRFHKLRLLPTSNEFDRRPCRVCENNTALTTRRKTKISLARLREPLVDIVSVNEHEAA